jgi:hypothetical protein
MEPEPRWSAILNRSGGNATGISYFWLSRTQAVGGAARDIAKRHWPEARHERRKRLR